MVKTISMEHSIPKVSGLYVDIMFCMNRKWGLLSIMSKNDPAFLCLSNKRLRKSVSILSSVSFHYLFSILFCIGMKHIYDPMSEHFLYCRHSSHCCLWSTPMCNAFIHQAWIMTFSERKTPRYTKDVLKKKNGK